jgi:hypothetical protein
LVKDNVNNTWYTKGANMVNIENELGLGWWDVSDPNYQIGQHVITALEPVQILVASQAGLVLMDTITTMMVQQAQTNFPSNGQGQGGLMGLPPSIFNGDRSKSDLFLDKFLGYELINGDN